METGGKEGVTGSRSDGTVAATAIRTVKTGDGGGNGTNKSSIGLSHW